MNDWTGNADSIWKTLGAPHNRIWECACGGGHLSERLTERGYYVYSSDIVDRGYKRLTRTRDFLTADTGAVCG